MDELHQKKAKLETHLKSLGSVAVAFSCGVDSSFLLKTAHDLLGGRAVAVTACAPTLPKRELEEAKAFCAARGIRHIVLDVSEKTMEAIKANPPDRCYHCKRALFGELLRTAKEEGFAHVAEGSNADDCGDYRPGMRAVAELGVVSPLKDAGLTKAEIRALSKECGLPTWNKPSAACLASRVAYGEPITEEKLARIGRAEQLLLDLGLQCVRVRVHGTLARIELDPADFETVLRPQIAESINRRLQELGFLYVTLDLGGFVSGSMNKALLP